jgi:hypothetical protein
MLVAVVFKVSEDIRRSVGIKEVLNVLKQTRAGQAHKEHLIA